MNKYESFLERNTIKLYHAADEYYSLSERGLEYRDKASICVDLVIFILDTLNQSANHNGVDQAKGQFISATRLVFPIKTYFTALDFAYSKEEAIEILKRLSSAGDDPENLTNEKFDFKKLMEACYFVRVNSYFKNSNLQITLPSAYAKDMVEHLNLDQNNVSLINAFEKTLLNIAVQLQKFIYKDKNLVVESAPKRKIKNIEKKIQNNNILVCSTCTFEVRVQKETGKYRCPNCKSLTTYINDERTTSLVEASELISVSPETEATPKSKAYQKPPIITPDTKQKLPKTKNVGKNSVGNQNDDQNTPNLFDNIIWFIKSVGLMTAIWTISISLLGLLISGLDQTGGVIVSGLIFFGTFYFVSTLDGFGDPPSRYHYQELFELALGLFLVVFGPVTGALVAVFLFWW